MFETRKGVLNEIAEKMKEELKSGRFIGPHYQDGNTLVIMYNTIVVVDLGYDTPGILDQLLNDKNIKMELEVDLGITISQIVFNIFDLEDEDNTVVSIMFSVEQPAPIIKVM